MLSKTIATAVFILLSLMAEGQVNRYIVFYKNKTGTPFSLSIPEQFLSARSLQRRAKNNVTMNEADLPVNPAYVAGLKAEGAEVYYSSRWLNATLIQTTPEKSELIAALPFVDRIEQVAPGAKLSGGRTRHSKNRKESGIAPQTLGQLSMLGVDAMHTDGFRGEGVLIAVFDSGFLGVDSALPFAHLYTSQAIKGTFDLIGNSNLVYRYDDHGTEVFSVIGAKSNSYTGAAPHADFILFVTEDVTSEYRIEEYNWLFAAEKADSAGVDIIQSSLGYNTFDDGAMDYTKADLTGNFTVISKAAALAINRGIAVVSSAGNEGNGSWKLVTPPADVEGVFAVGAITSTQQKSSFSSIGPTADGRVKPDVVALGSGTQVIRPSGSNGTTNGTSVAAPLITGLLAGLIQALPEFTVGELYEIVTTTASQGDSPDNFLGYGIPNYVAVAQEVAKRNPKEEIAIFPNPITGETVKIVLKTTDQQVNVQLHELQGKKLMDQTTWIQSDTNPLEVDLTPLPAGMYLLTVTTAHHSRTERIVKK